MTSHRRREEDEEARPRAPSFRRPCLASGSLDSLVAIRKSCTLHTQRRVPKCPDERLTGLCAVDAGCAERNHQPEHAAEHHRCHVRRGIVNTRPRRRGRASCARNRTRRASRPYAYASRSGHPPRSPIVRIAFPEGPLPDAPCIAHQLLSTNCDQTVERRNIVDELRPDPAAFQIGAPRSTARPSRGDRIQRRNSVRPLFTTYPALPSVGVDRRERIAAV